MTELIDVLLEQQPAQAQRIIRNGTQSPETLRRRRVKAVQRGTIPMPQGPSAYTLSGKVIAEASAAALWTGSWLFNGLCTVLAWLALVDWLAVRMQQSGAVWTELALQIPAGVILHIAISAMEQHLWRSLEPVPPGLSVQARAERLLCSVRTWESVLVGAVDSAATSRILLIPLAWLGVGGMSAIVAAALAGTALALAAEPMMRFHGVGLKMLSKGVRR